MVCWADFVQRDSEDSPSPHRVRAPSRSRDAAQRYPTPPSAGAVPWPAFAPPPPPQPLDSSVLIQAIRDLRTACVMSSCIFQWIRIRRIPNRFHAYSTHGLERACAPCPQDHRLDFVLDPHPQYPPHPEHLRILILTRDIAATRVPVLEAQLLRAYGLRMDWGAPAGPGFAMHFNFGVPHITIPYYI